VRLPSRVGQHVLGRIALGGHAVHLLKGGRRHAKSIKGGRGLGLVEARARACELKGGRGDRGGLGLKPGGNAARLPSCVGRHVLGRLVLGALVVHLLKSGRGHASSRAPVGAGHGLGLGGHAGAGSRSGAGSRTKTGSRSGAGAGTGQGGRTWKEGRSLVAKRSFYF